MGSRLIGRTPCPECGFGAAHIKQREEEGKRPYRYCPECGSQHFARTDRQAADLMAKLRPEKGAAAAPTPAPAASPTATASTGSDGEGKGKGKATAPAPEPVAESKPAPRRGGLFSRGIA